MNRNIGTIDRIIRVLFLVVVALLYLRGLIDGAVAAVLGTMAFALLATGSTGISLLYILFDINTHRKER